MYAAGKGPVGTFAGAAAVSRCRLSGESNGQSDWNERTRHFGLRRLGAWAS
jgi:hypothetical protein